MTVRYIPRTVRLKLFKAVYWFEQIHFVWLFLKNEWQESWEEYGWVFGIGDFASKMEFWSENVPAFEAWMERKAYHIARKKLAL